MEHPIGVRLLLLMGFVVGLGPFSLRSILKGRPEFSWWSGGVILAVLNLIGECFVAYVKLTGTSDQMSRRDEVKMQSTSTDMIVYNLQMMTTHLCYNLAVLIMLKEGKEATKTFEMASQLATATGSNPFVGSNSSHAIKGWLKRSTGFPQCLWMACAGSLVAFGTLAGEAVPPGWKFYSVVFISGKSVGAVFFICSTIWYFSDSVNNGFAAILKKSDQLLSHSGDQREPPGQPQGLHLDARAALVEKEVPGLHKVYTLAGRLCDQFSRTHGHAILVNSSAHLIIMTIHLYYLVSLVPALIKDGLGSSDGSRPSNGVILSLCGSVLVIRAISLTLGCITSHGVITQDEDFRARMKEVLLDDIGVAYGPMQEGTLQANKEEIHAKTWASKVLFSPDSSEKAIDDRDEDQMIIHSRIPQSSYFKRYSMKTRQLLKDMVNTNGVTINASGYYSLEKGTVVAIVNTIATYVIILIQFRQADPAGGGAR